MYSGSMCVKCLCVVSLSRKPLHMCLCLPIGCEVGLVCRDRRIRRSLSLSTKKGLIGFRSFRVVTAPQPCRADAADSPACICLGVVCPVQEAPHGSSGMQGTTVWTDLSLSAGEDMASGGERGKQLSGSELAAVGGRRQQHGWGLDP
jgi:hypothetical protein